MILKLVIIYIYIYVCVYIYIYIYAEVTSQIVPRNATLLKRRKSRRFSNTCYVKIGRMIPMIYPKKDVLKSLYNILYMTNK